MKKIIITIMWFTGLIVACNQPRSDFSDVPVTNDSTDLEVKVDSANSVPQDGLDYDPLNTGTYNQLPAILTQWLNQDYAGWSLPTISEDFLKKTKRAAPGPFYLEGYFNKDQLGDFAVLFQYKDSITVAAYLPRRTGEPQKFIMERQPLLNTSQENISPHYLTFPKKEVIKTTRHSDRGTTLPEQTIGVVSQSNSTRYYYYNGKSFSQFTNQQDRLKE